MTDSFQGHALIVSVHVNADHRLPDLGESVNADGDLIQKILLDRDVCGYGPTHVRRLSGEEATASRIADAFHQLSDISSVDDPFFFYFSGHGAETSCDGSSGASLFPSDADLDRCRNVLSSGVLADVWRRVRSRRKLAVVDACYSGGLTITNSATHMSKRIAPKQLNILAEGEGSVLISSSRSTEASLIMGTDNLSLFTKHLAHALLGFGGHDEQGYVRVFDLFNYVAAKTRQDSPHQSPVYAASHQDQNFAVAFCSSETKRKTMDPVIDLSSDQERLNVVSSLFESLYPLGPIDQSIWERSGGNLSQLTLRGHGRSDWFRSIRFIIQGGGSSTIEMLCNEALLDYPRNRNLEHLLDSL